MKIAKLFFIIFCFIQLLNTLNAQENSSVHQHWTKEYSDPVELTKELIRKTDVFWTPLGKTTLVLTYKVGFTTARFGGRYILLESPNIVIDLAKGGIYEAIGSIAYDGMLDIIKRSIKSPDKLCESIAWSLIKQGLDEYEISYSIARKYIETRELNITEAMDFLKNRWGVFKLGIARQLYLDSQKNYSIDEQLAERAIKEVLDKFEDVYKSRLDMNDNLPLMDAAFFIKDLFDIIEQKKIGLANYEPYLKFNERIEELNRIRIEEHRKFLALRYTLRMSNQSLPQKIKRSILGMRFYDPCINSSQLPESHFRIDLNDDEKEEYIIWIVGCPETRGRGQLYIYSGFSQRLILDHFGYDITGWPPDIEILNPSDKNENIYHFYHAIKIGRTKFYYDLGGDGYWILNENSYQD